MSPSVTESNAKGRWRWGLCVCVVAVVVGRSLKSTSRVSCNYLPPYLLREGFSMNL